jgi:hypothetical protein
MKFDAQWWKIELGQQVEKIKENPEEVKRLSAVCAAAGAWSKIMALQLAAMKATGIKPCKTNMPDLL